MTIHRVSYAFGTNPVTLAAILWLSWRALTWGASVLFDHATSKALQAGVETDD